MSIIYVPWYLDEHLPTLNVPIPGPATVITPPLPEADIWTRLAVLYRPVAAEVQNVAATGARPTVISGDCTVSLAVAAGIQATCP